jgi:hypothetical protein
MAIRNRFPKTASGGPESSFSLTRQAQTNHYCTTGALRSSRTAHRKFTNRAESGLAVAQQASRQGRQPSAQQQRRWLSSALRGKERSLARCRSQAWHPPPDLLPVRGPD